MSDINPDVELQRIRDAILWTSRATKIQAPLVEIIDAFNNLDDWLSKGGYLPAQWQQAAYASGGEDAPMPEASDDEAVAREVWGTS